MLQFFLFLCPSILGALVRQFEFSQAVLQIGHLSSQCFDFT